MNIKQIEKANKILLDIKILDSEIIELEKFAMLIADGEVTIDFSLNVHDLKKKREQEEKISFDEDGSLISALEKMRNRLSYYSPFAMGGLVEYQNADSKSHVKNLTNILNENEGLQVLGVLLGIKQQKRQRLIESLNKIGVNL